MKLRQWGYLVALGLLWAMPAQEAQAAPRPASIFSWTGFYVGAHGGGAWANTEWITDVTLPAPPFERVDPNLSSWLGGGHAGYRWQLNNWVVGVEGTFSWTNLSKFAVAPHLNPGAFPNRFRLTEMDKIYAVTAQVGYAWNNWLLYGKGGWAGSDVTLKHDNINAGGSKATWDDTADGWTTGVGIEWGFAPNWSLGVEYNYYNLSTGRLSTVNSVGLPVRVLSFDTDIHSAVARLNYRFDWGRR